MHMKGGGMTTGEQPARHTSEGGTTEQITESHKGAEGGATEIRTQSRELGRKRRTCQREVAPTSVRYISLHMGNITYGGQRQELDSPL